MRAKAAAALGTIADQSYIPKLEETLSKVRSEKVRKSLEDAILVVKLS